MKGKGSKNIELSSCPQQEGHRHCQRKMIKFLYKTIVINV